LKKEVQDRLRKLTTNQTLYGDLVRQLIVQVFYT